MSDHSIDPPSEEERDRMTEYEANGFHTYYGSPFVAEIDGRWLMCVEDRAGYGSWRRVSADFAQAWIREFAEEVPLPAPVGTGGVRNADPHPLVVETLDKVPPRRDNGDPDGKGGV